MRWGSGLRRRRCSTYSPTPSSRLCCSWGRAALTTPRAPTTSDEWGGWRSRCPGTFATFTVGGLAIAGIPPFSGFWSKDEILAAAWHYEKGVYVLGIIAAFLTSVYIFRLIFITFLGSYRGGEEPQHGEHVPDHPSRVAGDHGVADGHTGGRGIRLRSG